MGKSNSRVVTPRVSIILPVYNGERFIQDAIKSVQAQSYTDWELLIVDDGSSDGTAAVIKAASLQDERIVYCPNEKNLGIQKTLNHGIKEAKGEYIARIDDDDIWVDADKLAKQVAFLDAHPICSVVGTGTIEIDEQGHELFRFLPPENDRAIRRKILQKNCFTHSSVMFRRDVAQSLGGYSESQETLHLEDYDLWLRMGIQGEFHNLPIYGVQFRLRGGSISGKNKIDQFRKARALIKKYGAHYPNKAYATLYAFMREKLYSVYLHMPFKEQIRGIYKRT